MLWVRARCRTREPLLDPGRVVHTFCTHYPSNLTGEIIHTGRCATARAASQQHWSARSPATIIRALIGCTIRLVVSMRRRITRYPEMLVHMIGGYLRHRSGWWHCHTSGQTSQHKLRPRVLIKTQQLPKDQLWLVALLGVRAHIIAQRCWPTRSTATGVSALDHSTAKP